MTDETQRDETKKLWQDQPLEGRTMSVKEVHERIERLGRHVQRRNLIGGFACTVVMLEFAYFFMGLHNAIERAGAVLTIVGAGYILYQVVARRMNRQGASESRAETSLDFYRSQLMRQRDFHRGKLLWSRILIFAPGPFVFLIGMVNSDPTLIKYVIVEGAVAAALLIYAVPRNLRVARRYQRELDVLESGCR